MDRTCKCYTDIDSEYYDKLVKYSIDYEDTKLKHEFKSHKIDKGYVNIVGYTTGICYSCYDKNSENDYLKFIEENNNYFAELTKNKRFLRRNVGYVRVGEGEYVALTKSWFIIFLILIGVAILSFITTLTVVSGKINNYTEKPQTDNNITLEFEKDNDWDGTLPQNGQELTPDIEYTTFPGYANLYFSKDSNKLQLINPDENTVYLVYDIKLDGTSIIKTKAIKPGNMKEVNLVDVLAKGNYTLIFSISTYDVNSQSPCNSVDQVVNVTIN